MHQGETHDQALKKQQFIDQLKADAAAKGEGFAADDGSAVVAKFQAFADENRGALPLSSILDIAEALISIIIKDQALLTTIKSVIAIIRRFVPATA